MTNKPPRACLAWPSCGCDDEVNCTYRHVKEQRMTRFQFFLLYLAAFILIKALVFAVTYHG